MSWPHLPADYDGPAWIWCPNRLYDPSEGHRLYNEYMDLLEHTEELGFDGICGWRARQGGAETEAARAGVGRAVGRSGSRRVGPPGSVPGVAQGLSEFIAVSLGSGRVRRRYRCESFGQVGGGDAPRPGTA